jgi:hypothetical protein
MSDRDYKNCIVSPRKNMPAAAGNGERRRSAARETEAAGAARM